MINKKKVNVIVPLFISLILTLPIPVYPLNNIGLDIIGEIQYGPVVSGRQKESGLRSGSGESGSTSKKGMGISLLYHPIDKAGAGLKYSWLGMTASVPGEGKMAFTKQVSWEAYLDWLLYTRPLQKSSLQFFIQGGGFYTWMKLYDGYADFVDSHINGSIIREYAKGFGYFLNPGVRLLVINNVFCQLGISYRFEDPKFPHAPSRFYGGMIGFNFGIGYRL